MRRELFRPFLGPPVRQEHLLRSQGPPVQQERLLRLQGPPVHRGLFLQFQDPRGEETQERQELQVPRLQGQQELEDPRDLRKMV